MNRLELPVNIHLMDTNNDRVGQMRKVTSLDTFDGGGSTSNFHPEGLFSVEIFGRVGSVERDNVFAIIDTKIRILHPFIYSKICRLKGLYKEILHGKQFAKWDEEAKDFVSSDAINGDTGYHFFVTHLPKIEFKRTESSRRILDIELVTKAINDGTAFTHRVPVIPAGMRDVYVEADGRVSEDEINPFYRSLLSATNAIPDTTDLESPAFNTTRVSMQNALNNIFDYLWNLYEGKRGFGQRRYYSRGVFNGTRNVLSAMDTATEKLGSPKGPKLNHSVVGLFQVMKALLPVAQHLILNGWLSKVFSAGDGRAYLVNPRTLKRELITVNRKEYDRWNTPDGIAKVIDGYFEREVRMKPVKIADYYIGLVYRGRIGDKDVFRFFDDIDDLPENMSKEDVYPITLVELLYIAGYRNWNTYPMMMTRYPVAGLGSTYMSYFYVKTTTNGISRYELDDDWNIIEDVDNKLIPYALEYPDFKQTNFVETASPHPSRLAGLSGDFDGDTGSQNGFYTQEAIAEINKNLNSAKAYLNPKGGFLNSPRVETVERVIVGLMRR